MAAPKTQSIGPFPLGMDNRVPDFKLELPNGAGHLLRDALNVDVSAEGTIKTRAGYARTVSTSDGHSLWAPVSGDFALFADAGTIYRLGGAGTVTPVATGFGSAGPVRYAEVNEAVYFTDGLRFGSYHPVPGPTPTWVSASPRSVGDQPLTPMPAGQHIAFRNGRLLVTVGAALIYSEPFTPHLRDEARGFELFPAPITCLAAVEAGVIVVADKTYFAPGGFPAQELRAVLDYGAPEQQPSYSPDGSAHWMSARGVVVCSRGGEVANVQEAHVAMKAEGQAATLYREADGLRAIVAALSEPSSIGTGIGSYAQARVIRKGA